MEREEGWYIVKVSNAFRNDDQVEIAYWNGWWQLAGVGGEESGESEVIEVLSGNLDLVALMNKDKV